MTVAIYVEVASERGRQDAKWGEQNHPDGTGPNVAIPGSVLDHASELRDWARFACKRAGEAGQVTWMHILCEQVYEALAEHEPAALRAELVQVAATTIAWIEAIDRRPA